jgi:hypothetical protein
MSGPGKRENMVVDMDYKSTIKTRPFFYNEMRTAAALKLQGFKDFEIREKSKKENIFQVNTDNRKNEIASSVLQRLKILDDYLLREVAEGTIDTSKIIVLYTIMKTDRLFLEFMNEVYREKLIIRDFVLSHKDFNLFFQRKREQSERVASWSDYTFYKLKQVYIRILTEAGLIRKDQRETLITRPFIEQEVMEHLKARGDSFYLKVLLGEI